jgi:site-specific DNA recombinase
VPSPSGKQWTASTINGSRGRGILYNEAYIGRLVWNRSSGAKDPETGRRVARLNPTGERLAVAAEHLRIVPDDLWTAAQARKRENGSDGQPEKLHKDRRPRHLFSGLVRCGCCSGAYAIKSKDRLSCVNRYQRGTCDNERTIRVSELERRVFDGLKVRLLAPNAIAAFLREYHEERRRLSASSRQRRAELASRVARLRQQIENIADAIAGGVSTVAMNKRLVALEADAAEGEAELAELDATATGDVVELHPGAAEGYRQRVENLHAALAGDEVTRREAAAILRGLVSAIEVHPGAGRGETELRIRGILAGILNLAQQPMAVARTVKGGGGDGIRTHDTGQPRITV